MNVKWSEMTPTQRDMLVAEKVMGLQRVSCASQGMDHKEGHLVFNRDQGIWRCRTCNAHSLNEEDELFQHSMIFDPLPCYTTDMNAALQVIELDQFTNAQFEHIGSNWLLPPELRYLCRIVTHGDLYYCNAATAQEAVCLTALYACGLKIEE